MAIPIDGLPPRAQAALDLRDELVALMADDLVAVWLHGGTTFPDRPEVPGDLDVTAVFAQVQAPERDPEMWCGDSTSRPRRIADVEKAIGDRHQIVFDTTYLLAADMAGGELPTLAFRAGRTLTAWAIERSHWLAGQYTLLHGATPDQLISPPTRAELAYALDRELEHIERHVYEGDAADSYEATYAVWTGCRILYSLEVGTPVVSKRSAGTWALEHLSPEWHPAIHAAGRSYDGSATPGDETLLRANMAPFVKMVRGRFPAVAPRPPGPPRWS